MTNVNAPYGFRPTMRTRSGAAGSLAPANKLAGYGTALFKQDAVTQAASDLLGTLCISAAITPGTTPILGVNLEYGAASTATNHHIVVANNAIFVVQGDGTGATYLVPASMSKNANIALTAGSATLFTSQHELSETSLATTNTLDLKVRGLYQSPNNAAGQYAQVFVSFNNLVDGDQKAGI